MLLISACVEQEFITPPVGNTLVVHGVLDPSSRDQVVAVQIARGSTTRLESVTGASVLLTLPDGRQVQATTDTATTPFDYHFRLDGLGFELVPGGTYRLEIRVPDGRVVTGHTTIPLTQPVSLEAPVEDMRYRRDTVRLRWARVPAARTYEVSASALVGGHSATNSFFADTSVDLTTSTTGPNGTFLNGTTFLFLGIPNRVAVTAVDSNYYDYYRRESDFLTGIGLITHLDGAEGLFGSVVPIAVRSLKVVF